MMTGMTILELVLAEPTKVLGVVLTKKIVAAAS
jgi:hypothetical protein